MSKVAFLVGVLISVFLHWWILNGAGNQALEKTPLESLVAVEILEMNKKTNQESSIQPEQKEISVAAQSDEVPKEKPVPDQKPKEPAAPTPPPAEIKIEPSHKQQYSAATEKGDFSGSTEGENVPILRIDWGEVEDAVRILQKSGMRLVVLDAQPRIVAELSCHENRWERQAPSFDVHIVYSSNLRIVDRVPAFQHVTTPEFIKTDEHLAVMIPMKLETMIESEKMKAAFQRGLTFEMIKIFGGYFYLKNDRVYFKVDKIQERG